MGPVEQWLEFFERGGYVVWVILGVSSLMWMLIVERYWFVTVVASRRHARLVEEWRGLAQVSPVAREWMRRGMLMQHRAELHRYLPTIMVMTAVLPLLGLFGTVGGMIQSFDAITLFGTGNPRGMAAGISQALLTTMAGLVTALSGIYFSSNLEERAIAVQHRLEADLSSTEDTEVDDDDE